MSKQDYKIAVIDLGKTNKKIVIFSPDLEIISKESTQIEEKNIEGIISDDILKINEWILSVLKEKNSKYKISVISPTTFGATVVSIDNTGNLVFPVISYTNEPEEKTRKKFYDIFGKKEEIYLKTATPGYGQLLNAGLTLFWMKETNPEKWNKIKHILFLPQYEGYFFTGKKAVEYTSIGCHTYLYDFKHKNWSNIAREIGVKIPKKISLPWSVLGNLKPEISNLTGLNKNCKVTVGIHDSNASLFPYLLKKKRNFLLASTGTWCVFMYPGADFRLSVEDMYKDTLYYIDPFGKPVRASRFKGGEEHDYYVKLIESKYKGNVLKLSLDIKILNSIISENKCFVIPTLTPGSGLFPYSKPEIIEKDKFYQSMEIAYHVLCLSLSIQSYFAIKQVIGEKKNIPIFVEGGFRNNSIYMSILSALFPENKLISTSIQEATSLGAAICGKCAYENIAPYDIDLKLINIDEKPIKKPNINRKLLEKYIDKFKNFCERGKK